MKFKETDFTEHLKREAEMQKIQEVKEGVFKELLKEKLGEDWERALKIFHKYGAKFSFDVANVLLHAIDKDKVKEVLNDLAAHNPADVKKLVHKDGKCMFPKMGQSTEEVLVKIFQETLGLV